MVDSNTTGGAWTDDNGIDIEDVVFWNAQVGGEVFQVGSLYEGQTSGFRFSVLAVLDDGDNTGALITARKNGTLTLNEDIHLISPGDILGNKIAQLESTTTVLAAATLNLPGGVRTEQRSAGGVNQGGIFGPTVSLNIRRSSNAFFSLIKGDTFPLLAQLDDRPPIDGNVKDSLYTVLTAADWLIPTDSFRFLEKGSWKDEGSNNLWTNYIASKAVFTSIDITDNGFLYTSTNPRPMPDAYLEENGIVLERWWLEGPFDVISKVKTTSDTQIIDPATPALGQLINGALKSWFSRPYGRKYAHFDNSAQAQAATIVLANPDDSNNNTGQYRSAFTSGGGGAFTVGEELETADGTKVGVVTVSDTGATGDVDYILRSTTQFVNTDVVTGNVSGKTATFGTPTNVVAGYGTDVRTMVIDRRFLGGTTTVSTFIIGEQVSQATSGYDGFVMEDDAGDIYVQDVPGTAAPDGTNQLSGDTSGALNTPTSVADFTTVPKDLGEGSGDLNYAGVTSGDILGSNARLVADVYEWDKFRTDENALTIEGGRGTLAGVAGRIYRGFDPTFAEILEAPYGTFGAGIYAGAEGHFIQKETLDAGDLQNIRVTPIGATELTPPNLQNSLVSNVATDWSVFFYRSTGAASELPLITEFQIGASNLAANSVIVLQAGDRSVSPTPSDVPDTGVLKAEDPNNPGIFLRYPYNALNRTTNTYTLTSGTIGDVSSGTALTQGEDGWVALIEENAGGSSVSNASQFVGNFEFVGGARKKGFDDFISTGQWNAGGGTVAVVQTPDGVVNLP